MALENQAATLISAALGGAVTLAGVMVAQRGARRQLVEDRLWKERRDVYLKLLDWARETSRRVDNWLERRDLSDNLPRPHGIPGEIRDLVTMFASQRVYEQTLLLSGNAAAFPVQLGLLIHQMTTSPDTDPIASTEALIDIGDDLRDGIYELQEQIRQEMRAGLHEESSLRRVRLRWNRLRYRMLLHKKRSRPTTGDVRAGVPSATSNDMAGGTASSESDSADADTVETTAPPSARPST